MISRETLQSRLLLNNPDRNIFCDIIIIDRVPDRLWRSDTLFFYLYLIWWDGFMPNRNNLFYDAVNTVAHSHVNCACNNAYRNIYPQFCGTSRHRPPLSLFFPPLQICYDTTYTFFVGAIIGRPFNMYPSSLIILHK